MGERRFWAVIVASWIAAVASLATVPVTYAQAQEDLAIQAEDPAESRSTAFRAVTGPTTESVPGGPLLIGAYAVVWTLVLLFVVRMAFLHAKTARELAELERRLADKTGAPRSE